MKILNAKKINSQSQLTLIDSIAGELATKLPPARPQTKIVVIIPAKNEALDIEKTLLALLNQKSEDSSDYSKLKFEILILCHNCNDDTFKKCQEVKTALAALNLHILKLNSDVANTVGAARRILMNIACERLKHKNSLIASTDADTIAHELWLNHLENYLNKDVHLVCGLINADYGSINGQVLKYLLAKDHYLMLQAQLESLLLNNPNDPWPRHNYSWGPNLAIKKYVYQKLGGIKPLSFLEDVDLYNRVIEKGFKVKHCMDASVTTSVRIDSRCEEGFGAELKVWTENKDIPYRVEGLQKLKLRYHIYNLIRSYYQNPSSEILQELSILTLVDIKELAILVSQFKRYEGMMIYIKQYLNTNPTWNSCYPNISVFEANQELEAYLSEFINH